MNVSSNATDLVSVQGLIEPVAGAAVYSTGYFYAGDANAWEAIVSAGTVGTTVDALIQQASDGSGTGVKTLSGSAITQLSAAGSALIQFKPSDLDVANDFTHVRLTITTVGATSVASGVLQGACVAHAPLAAGAKVDETVTV